MKSLLLCLLLITVLAGCSVYVPIQPTMPLLEERGQLEAAISVQPSTRVEGTIAYSPLAHVVLTGAGTAAFKWRNEPYLITRQGELGMGGYWGLGTSWLLTATSGGGYAYTHINKCVWGCDEYQARYRKLFGQVGIAHFMPQSTLGLTYRLSKVSYSRVQANDLVVPNFGTMRHEMSLQGRRNLGGSSSWFTQYTLGISFSNLESPSQGNSDTHEQQWHVAGLPAVFYGFGIVWQPTLKRVAKQSVP